MLQETTKTPTHLINIMKKLLLAIAVACIATSPVAFAADAPGAPTAEEKKEETKEVTYTLTMTGVT